jgi:hypothetical protein
MNHSINTNNPAFKNDLLIRADGSIDWDFIAVAAKARAEARYGAETTASDIEFCRERCISTAEILQARYRQERGLSDETAYVAVTPFGRQSEGVRRSAF